MFTGVLITLAAAGCVERQLTINTQPQGAVVTLNDEEIGTQSCNGFFQLVRRLLRAEFPKKAMKR